MVTFGIPELMSELLKLVMAVAICELLCATLPQPILAAAVYTTMTSIVVAAQMAVWARQILGLTLWVMESGIMKSILESLLLIYASLTKETAIIISSVW